MKAEVNLYFKIYLFFPFFAILNSMVHWILEVWLKILNSFVSIMCIIKFSSPNLSLMTWSIKPKLEIFLESINWALSKVVLVWIKLSGISEWNEWCSKGKSRNCRLNVLGADGVLHANSQDRIMNLVQLV